MRPDSSMIVPSRNRPRQLSRCLRAIAGLVALLAVWQAANCIGFVTETLFPGMAPPAVAGGNRETA